MSWADDEGISGYDIEGELDAAERRRPRTRHTITPQQELKWRTAEGVYYYPWEMTDAHIKNCLLHIQEHVGLGAPATAWHRIFRCELKRREVQNAHQPPTAPERCQILARGKTLEEALAKLSDVFERRGAAQQTKRVSVKRPTKKGRKTK